MATPRSRAATPFTTRPSSMTWPPLMTSSPAIIRSRVDFPHPDGPTNTTNSPSSMSSDAPWMTATEPYRFDTSRRAIAPIAPSLY